MGDGCARPEPLTAAENRSRYAALLPRLREVAGSLGYALGVHGSMERDLDVIAAPWRIEVAPAEQLVEALRAAVDGLVPALVTGPYDEPQAMPVERPHGRRAWNIYLRGDPEFPTRRVMPYIDLSVMPRQAA